MGTDRPGARRLVAGCGVLGPVMLAAYFIVPLLEPPLARVVYAANPATAQVVAVGARYHLLLAAGSWLQATGALLSVVFFVALADLAVNGAVLARRIIQLGSAVLLAVVCAEAVFTLTWASAAVHGQPASSRASFDLMSAFIRVFPMVPAPAVYLAVGAVLLASTVLPRLFAHLAIGLGVAFAAAGLAGVFAPAVTAATAGLSALQIVWIIAAAVTLARRQQP
jgi:hypothetical protein